MFNLTQVSFYFSELFSIFYISWILWELEVFHCSFFLNACILHDCYLINDHFIVSQS